MKPLRRLLGLSLFCLLVNHSQADELDLFILAGQSNAQGWTGDAAHYPPDTLDQSIPFFWVTPQHSSSKGKWTHLQVQGGRYEKGHFGPEVELARALKKHGHQPAIFKYTLGGTSIANDWQGPGDGKMYDQMVASLKAALSSLNAQGHVVKVRGFIWIQGESDAQTPAMAKAYKGRLRRLIDDVRNNVIGNPQLSVILGVDEQHPLVVKNPQVLEAQQQLADEIDNVVFTSMYGFEKADTTHLTPTGLKAQGKRLYLAASCHAFHPSSVAAAKPPVGRQQAYVDQGQGLFLHFGLETYLSMQDNDWLSSQWASPETPISVFNPTELDTDQWADAAVSAGMKFGVLTTKHHNGFALWDSALSTHDVASTAWYANEQAAGRSGDVVKRYVDSFRRRGLEVGLYFSIWDRVVGIEDGVTHLADGTPVVSYIKDQLSELLGTPGNRPYGEIQSLWFDGWGWEVTYPKLPYHEIRDHVRRISPNTVIINNDHLECYNSTDIISFEQDFDATSPLPYPYVERSWTIASDKTWFWNPDDSESQATRSLDLVANDIKALRQKGGLTLFNIGPDEKGQISEAYLSFLKGLGQAIQNQ